MQQDSISEQIDQIFNHHAKQLFRTRAEAHIEQIMRPVLKEIDKAYDEQFSSPVLIDNFKQLLEGISSFVDPRRIESFDENLKAKLKASTAHHVEQTLAQTLDANLDSYVDEGFIYLDKVFPEWKSAAIDPQEAPIQVEERSDQLTGVLEHIFGLLTEFFEDKLASRYDQISEQDLEQITRQLPEIVEETINEAIDGLISEYLGDELDTLVDVISDLKKSLQGLDSKKSVGATKARGDEAKAKKEPSQDIDVKVLAGNQNPEKRTKVSGADILIEGEFVVDGLNVCRDYPRGKSDFSFEVLLSILVEIVKRGGSFKCIFDASAPYQFKNRNSHNLPAYSTLKQRLPDYFGEVPSGIRADDFILLHANEREAAIISNDTFSDYLDRYPWIKTEEQRLLKGRLLDGSILIPHLKFHIPLRNDVDSMVHELISRLGS